MAKKYIAYVGSYSYTGEAKGITVYDIDVKKGTFKKRCEVEVNNASYMIVSRDNKTLFSIADEGVVSFRILENGSLTRLNSVDIKGMRGCHLAVDKDNKHIFVSGYHDGKITALTINEDGSVGHIVDGIYHRGLGSIAERNFRPHVSCARRTPDNHFVLVADLGIDQVKVYKFDDTDEKLILSDTIRCDINSGPKFFKFSKDGRFLYLMYERKNAIDVFEYSYKEGDRLPKFEKIQTVSSTGNSNPNDMTAATALTMTSDGRYLLCANAGDNSVCAYERDTDSGLLTPLFCLPISGEYPKDIVILPGDKHLVSLNHESGSITFFNIDFEKRLITMCANEIKVNQPNCCTFAEV